MKVTAWIGVGFMLVSLFFYCSVKFSIDHTLDPRTPTMDFSFLIPMPFALIALLLMLIGGLAGRPKYFWIVSLLSGVYYIYLFSPFIRAAVVDFQHTEPAYRELSRYTTDIFIWFCVMGILLVIEGVMLFIKRNR